MANFLRRCRNPVFATRAAGDAFHRGLRALERRMLPPLHFYPPAVQRVARRFKGASVPLLQQLPPDPLPDSGTLDLASISFEYRGEPDWRATFHDPENEMAMHRWNWLLARPAVLGGARAFADGVALMRSWCRSHREIGAGPAWNSYTAGERISNACVFAYVADAQPRSLPPDIVSVLQRTALHVAQTVEYGGEEGTGNHVINEARALLFAEEVLGVPHAADLALAIVRAEIPRLVTADGFLREGSSHYQFLFTRWILEMLWVAEQNHNRQIVAILAPFAVPLIEACRFFVTSDQDGGVRIPLLGDVSPDFPPEWLISLPWSPLATRWSPAPDSAPATAPGWTELWMRRPPAGDSVPLRRNSAVLSYPRSWWHRVDSGAFTLFCRAESETGRRYASHRHGDLTGFALFADGHPLLIDSGRLNYRTDDALGCYGVSACAHNTVCVDGLEPQVPLGLIRLPGFYRANHVEVLSADAGGLAIRHDGFARLPGTAIVHTRRWHLGPDEFRVHDDFAGAATHQVDAFFHLAPGISVTRTGPAVVALTTPTRTWEMTWDVLHATVQIDRAADHPEPTGWFFAAYGRKTAATTVRISSSVRFPWRAQYVVRRLR